MNLNKIRLVEIELHSQCNRTCGFCPNSYIDRHSENKFMDKLVFKKLIDELATIKYNKYISFSRYNEPFMHRSNLEKKIKYIRFKLPFATLVTNTNGDFRTTGIDIDQLTIMDYDDELIEMCSDSERVMKLGKINNRAGALKLDQEKRTRPCFEPSYFVGVDYTGDVVPCCNVRHDVEKHKKFILGNLKSDSLYNILNSPNSKAFRKSLRRGQFPTICKYCNKEAGRYTQEKGGI